MELQGSKFAGRIGLIVIFVFAFLIWVTLHEHALSAKLDITVAPEKSLVTIDGRRAKSGISKVRPGNHIVKVSYGGFTSLSETVVANAHTTTPVGIVLLSNSATTARWYFDHPSDEKIAESISSSTNDRLAKQSTINAPLITKLPRLGPELEYRIDYGEAPGKTATHPVIKITADTPQARQDALQWIREEGFDPADYDIQFDKTAVVVQ